MSEEIQTLFPGKEVTLTSGEVITIKPFTFGQLPKALKIGQKLGTLLADLYKQGKFEDRANVSSNLMVIIGEGGEDLIELIGLGINKPRAWFDNLQGDDGITLTIAFLEVNIDFFTKKMMPQLSAAIQNAKFRKSAEA